jgi:hypothetical protein
MKDWRNTGALLYVDVRHQIICRDDVPTGSLPERFAATPKHASSSMFVALPWLMTPTR